MRVVGAAAVVFTTGALALAVAAPVAAAVPPVRHDLRVSLDPDRHWLGVEDELTLPATPAAGPVEFLLNGALKLTGSQPPAVEVPLDASTPGVGSPQARFFGINSSGAELWSAGRLKRYRVSRPAAGGRLRLRYEGRFDFGLAAQQEEYTRGFRETSGIVSPEGVYLAGSGFWYPHLGRDLVEYAVEVTQPAGWHVIGPGNGTSRDDKGLARWDSSGPVDEIALAGGPLVVYRESAAAPTTAAATAVGGGAAAAPGSGAVEALVYLRRADEALAQKYLTATRQYLAMYSALLGPYPYSKFALVENFWETGYGMPSYTLLGPQVIRFPFILTSSYPHEILHNWWGNSVFVDYESGNWCEGLTAYMADHLIQEQRGRGAEYRRDLLQKYRSYVREGRDFPLSEFRSRHSAATEAVGYGKTAMLFHMLRRKLGDDGFRRWARRLYAEQRGRQASFADVRRTLEAQGARDLGPFFAGHVGRPGAALLQLTLEEQRAGTDGSREVAFALEQKQAGDALPLEVPVVLQTTGGLVSAVVAMTGKRAEATVRTSAEPVALHVDPSFDVFRLLDPRETPASIGQLFGEPRILAVVPAAAGVEERDAYRRLLEGWRSATHEIEIRSDAELRELPADRGAWLLGRPNALAAKLFAPAGELAISDSSLSVAGETMPLAGHSAVLVKRHPGNDERAVGWIFADGLAALPGLGRKLPHYGKYSYLGFEGEEPTNVLKGQWAASESPLRLDLRPASDRGKPAPPLSLPVRRALAELPPAFSEKALFAHVAWLSAPEREGRGLGTGGLEAAAQYVADAFKVAGLQPGGDAGSYFQAFSTDRSPGGTPVTLRNVIGVLPGTRPEWRGQSAILCAHYDHLGAGFPDVHKGDEGRLHPGADDNASGVAVMLELAKALAAGERPQRTLVFVAFSGEEARLLGSRHYAANPPFPLEQTIGVINLDTVGRLFERKLQVLSTGSATEWPHIFRGAGFVTGLEARLIPEDLESSDQKSFIERGVPAVQLFTEPHGDYHRPGDTADKIDAKGLVKVATYVREAIAYLGERAEPLTNTIATLKGVGAPASAGAVAAGSPPGARRVSFGTVPDFAFAGPGVRVAGVTPGSPAEKAGVVEGDVLLRLDEQEIADLRGFSALLRGLGPGQRVNVLLRRGSEQRRLEVTVVER